MQIFIKCISALGLMLQLGINCSAICICPHDHEENIAISEQEEHSHCCEHTMFEPLSSQHDCHCSDMVNHFIRNQFDQKLVEYSEALVAVLTNDNFISPEIQVLSHPDHGCNSYAGTIRLRSQIWLI